MSYNGSGTYVPPAGVPVVSGTVIQSSVFNGVMSDIGNTFNNVLPRDGQAPMSAQLKLVDGTASSPGIGFNGEASTGMYRPGTGLLALTVAGVEVLRFNSSGRLVLGTTTDDGSNRLQVTGNAKITGDLAATGNLSITGNATITGTVNGSGTLSTGAITTTGSVGIGTSATELLDLYGATRALIRIRNGAGGGVAYLGPEAGGVVTLAADSAGNQLVFKTAATERVRISAAGNVGIATNSPTYKLHVAASNNINDGIAWTDTISSTGYLTTRNVSGQGGSGIGSDGFIAFSAGQGGVVNAFNERMRITGAGSVGIGTSAPQELLHVAGNIRLPAGNFIGWNDNAQLIWMPPGLNELRLRTNSQDRLFIDGNGNVGVGNLPNNQWVGGQRVLQVANGTMSGGSNAELWLCNNVVYGGSPVTDRYPAALGASSIGLTNGTIVFRVAGVGAAGNPITWNIPAQIDSTGLFTYQGAEVGFRDVPSNVKGGAYTLVNSDRGKMIRMDAVANVTVPGGLPQGSVYSVHNNTASNIQIVGSGVNIRMTGAGFGIASRTLSPNAMATIYMVTSSDANVSGAGVS